MNTSVEKISSTITITLTSTEWGYTAVQGCVGQISQKIWMYVFLCGLFFFFLLFCLMLNFQQYHILFLKGEEFMCLICMWCDFFLFLQQYINHTEFFQVYWMPLKLSIQNYTFSFIFSFYFFVCILQYAKFSLVNTVWVFCKMRGMIGSQIPDLNYYFSLSPPRIRSTYL